MKPLHKTAWVPIILCWLAIPWVVAVASDPEWPREYTNDKGRLVLYQPQVTSWDDFSRLDARIALAFAPTGTTSPSLGTVSVSARTDTNLEDHSVRIYDIRVLEGNFPTLDESGSERLIQEVLSVLPEESVVELERIVANLERFKSQERETDLKVEPPVIFVSTQPAILVLLDGKPLMSPIEDNELKFAVNTNWDLFELNGTYYLRNDDSWIKSEDLGGPWIPAGKLPKSFKKLPKKDPNWAEVRKNLPGRKITTDDVPAVYVSEAPAELILLDSEPTFSMVAGTKLLWVDNTDSDLFLSSDSSTFYYLVSGRWFRAASLDGPWSFATLDLPDDFARIPADHPRARVRSSVPGTPEAQEAILLAQIPQKATVNRSAAKPEVAYSGDPDFKPIEGTSMYYAVNTPNDVIRVGDIYYACFQGVWFASTRPTGPWEVADTIPSTIYTIPPSSPVYHTTYVRVYDSTPDYVVVGYTSGYTGLYVSYGCVWYGTGWYYPPYYYWGTYPYPVYYPYPYSYGVSAYYNPHTGTYGRGVYGYGPYGGWGYGGRYNPTTGTYGRGAAAWGPYQAGGWAQAYNPRTGTRAGTYQRATPYAHWGESVVRRGDSWVHTGHYSDSRGTVRGIETSRGGRGIGFSGEDGRQGFVGTGADNNLYAGRDGNVYRHDENGWSRHGEDGWEPVERPEGVRQDRAERFSEREPPATPRAGADRDRKQPERSLDQLERDRRARDRGAARARESRSWRSSAASRPSRGGFGRSGGLRGRRR
jgi:hypothetical protein